MCTKCEVITSFHDSEANVKILRERQDGKTNHYIRQGCLCYLDPVNLLSFIIVTFYDVFLLHDVLQWYMIVQVGVIVCALCVQSSRKRT